MPEVPGFYLNCGYWAGVMLSPEAGRRIARLVTGHAEHVSLIHSLAALPFVIWRLDVALAKRRWLPAFEAGAVLLATRSSYYKAPRKSQGTLPNILLYFKSS